MIWFPAADDEIHELVGRVLIWIWHPQDRHRSPRLPRHRCSYRRQSHRCNHGGCVHVCAQDRHRVAAGALVAQLRDVLLFRKLDLPGVPGVGMKGIPLIFCVSSANS